MKKLSLFIVFFTICSHYLLALDCTGDVRAKWITMWDENTFHQLKTEANVAFVVEKESAWFQTKMKASSIDFKDSKFSLEKALIGYHLWNREDMTIDIEAGRNRQDCMFESKIQHDSYFNGCNVLYHFKNESIDFLINGGPHLIDSSNSHVGIVGCAHWKKIAKTPFDFKYSLNHWGNHKKLGQKFIISQFLIRYDFGPGFAYGAYLNNHKAKMLADGLYFGYTHGCLRKAHDYYLDANVQYSKDNSVPAWDFCGLRKGIQLKGGYAVTDAFSLHAKSSYDIKRDCKSLEVSGIYAW